MGEGSVWASDLRLSPLQRHQLSVAWCNDPASHRHRAPLPPQLQAQRRGNAVPKPRVRSDILDRTPMFM